MARKPSATRVDDGPGTWPASEGPRYLTQAQVSAIAAANPVTGIIGTLPPGKLRQIVDECPGETFGDPALRRTTPRQRPDRAAETEIMHAIMVALSERGALVWRQNVGVAITRSGAHVRFGVVGMADIGVIYRGRAIQIEVKRPRRGKQSDAQHAWERAVIQRGGGIYVLARSVEDALGALDVVDASERRLVAAVMPGP